MKPAWITDNEQFAEVCSRLEKAERVAVDTEFVWTSTYYPRLALLQLASDKEDCVLVDVLEISDTAPFRAFLDNAAVLKVFHEAASDLPILARWCGGCIPQNVFDTRLAGGFCGMTAGCSLNRLLHDFLDILLTKSETRSDWLQRPLTDKQLEYAADDVGWLPELSRRMESKLQECGNLEMFREEMQEFSTESYYAEENPAECWRKVGGCGNLNTQGRGVLRELAKWREETAKSLDKTRRRLMTDEQMMTASIKLPENLSDLHCLKDFWPKQRERYGEAILEAIKRGRALTAAQCPPPIDIGMPIHTYREKVERVVGLARKRSETSKIDATLLCPKRRASDLVTGAWSKQLRPDAPFFETWRGRILGAALLEILFK